MAYGEGVRNGNDEKFVSNEDLTQFLVKLQPENFNKISNQLMALESGTILMTASCSAA